MHHHHLHHGHRSSAAASAAAASAALDVERLIQEVEARPPIYDLSHPEYTNKEIRDRYWEEIAYTVGYPVDECKRKWRNLRDAFMREVRREVKAGGGGGGTGGGSSDGPGPSKRKKYLHYDQMQFLVPILTNRRISVKTLPNVKQETGKEYREEEEGCGGGGGEEEEYLGGCGGGGGSWEALVETSLGAASLGEEEEERDRAFLLSLLPTLSRLGERERSRVRIQFQETLHNALYPPEAPPPEPPPPPHPSSQQAFVRFTQLLTALCLVLCSVKKD